MTKTEYMNKLKTYLGSLSPDEIEDILSDYDEHFEVGLSKGKTAEEISLELGDPYAISRNYINSSNNGTIDRNNSNNRLIIIFLLVAFNLVIVLTPYLSIVGILFGLYIAGISLGFGAIGLLFARSSIFIGTMARPHILTSLGLGIGLVGLGALTIILALYLTKLFIDLTKRYIRWNIEIVNKGGF